MAEKMSNEQPRETTSRQLQHDDVLPLQRITHQQYFLQLLIKGKNCYSVQHNCYSSLELCRKTVNQCFSAQRHRWYWIICLCSSDSRKYSIISAVLQLLSIFPFSISLRNCLRFCLVCSQVIHNNCIAQQYLLMVQ